MPNLWVARTRPSGPARTRLFCFPFAGGGTTGYRAWAGCFPADIEICPVQLPGRECRLAEPPARNLGRLVADLASGILPMLDVPFAFFGHSLGAIVAFEVARELARRRSPLPTHLFLSAHGPATATPPSEPFHTLPEDEFLKKVQQLGGLPDAVVRHPELLQIVLPALRADFEMYEKHRPIPGPPLAIPITALGGEDDEGVPTGRLESWRAETTARFGNRMFPGGHFYLQNAGPALAALVVRELASRPDCIETTDLGSSPLGCKATQCEQPRI
jgi:medium-chain acyl-[acyl-carrier-protein] hydrolase